MKHIPCPCPDCIHTGKPLCLECCDDWPCPVARYHALDAKFKDFIKFVDRCDPSITDAYILTEE